MVEKQTYPVRISLLGEVAEERPDVPVDFILVVRLIIALPLCSRTRILRN